MRILLAGATGYLGGYIAQELKARLIPSVLIGRNVQKLIGIAGDEAEIRVVEITDPETLKNCCDGIDVVISTVGITRQKDGLTYRDVDYQGNLNLLMEAKRAGVTRFVYLSAFKGASHRDLKIFEAKEAFVDALNHSGLQSVVIRPNGYFSDMEDFLDMAKSGKIYLFGEGRHCLNPIHGEDLAKVCVDKALSTKVEDELNIGGPDVISQRQIAELAIQAIRQANSEQKVKLVMLPDWARKVAIRLLRWFTPTAFYGPIEFFLTLMAEDYVAPKYGKRRLQDHYMQVANLESQDPG